KPSSLTFSLPPAFGSAPAPQTLTVTTSPSSTYSVEVATVYNPWLAVSPSPQLTGSQTLSVSMIMSSSINDSYGAIVFTSGNVMQSVPVTRNITWPIGPERVSAVSNAASYAGAAIVPGEIVSIFGTSLRTCKSDWVDA